LLAEIDWTVNESLKGICSFQIAFIVSRIFQIVLKVSRQFSLNVFWLQEKVELVLIVVWRSKWNKNEFWFFQILINKLRLLLIWWWKSIFFSSCVLNGQTFCLKTSMLLKSSFCIVLGDCIDCSNRYYVFQNQWAYFVLMMKIILI